MSLADVQSSNVMCVTQFLEQDVSMKNEALEQSMLDKSMFVSQNQQRVNTMVQFDDFDKYDNEDEVMVGDSCFNDKLNDKDNSHRKANYSMIAP